ncbi:MAG: hypothetical protein KC422_06395 [Trueperaceae bacterium]|nr:hypothetical protein [Trueperaceae bacterium]
MSNPKVFSQKGLFVYVWLIVLSIFTLFGVWGIVTRFQSLTSPKDFIGAFFGIPLMGYVVYHFSTLRVEISTEGIKTRTFFQRHNIPWTEFSYISTLTGFGYIPFRGLQMRLIHKNGNFALNIPIPFFRNREQMAQAIIEAARFANPSIRINSIFIDKYGSPPYGIFTENSSVQP